MTQYQVFEGYKINIVCIKSEHMNYPCIDAILGSQNQKVVITKIYFLMVYATLYLTQGLE